MSDNSYSDRELESKFKAADERADEFHNKLMERMDIFEQDVRNSLSRIELQTEKTNGRVNNLEKWQSYVIGFCACLTLLVVPVLVMMASKFFT